LIAASLTLPELVAVAEAFTGGRLELEKEDVDYLLLLLRLYGQEVLSAGQCVHFGSVTMSKGLSEQVIVTMAATFTRG
jgi:hypothetical protein